MKDGGAFDLPAPEARRGHRHINLMGWREAFAWGMVAG
jgi:hypothetical protein